MRSESRIARWAHDEAQWRRRIHEPFVLAALALALTAGFGYAAILVAALALRVPLGGWWPATVQAHGHAQLFGWLGLFVIGMALYFLPRLAGRELVTSSYAPYALALLAVGIAVRSIAQPLLSVAEPASLPAVAWRLLWLASALAELVGVVLIASMLRATFAARGRIAAGSPEWPVFPFVLTALLSLMLAFVLNLVGAADIARSSAVMLSPAWDGLTIRLMLYGLAVPMAIVFSVRNLPLFMRLAPPPRRELRTLAYVYAVALGVSSLAELGPLLGLNSSVMPRTAALGSVVQALAILVFVWRLDLVHGRRPWTAQRAPNTRPDLDYLRKPTRANYPDAGEYGRFELLIYSAYVWLIVSVLLELVRAGALLLGMNLPVPVDAERHALTVGFITLLIFGMAARLLPGFSRKRGVAYPSLVLATFVLGNLAALLRVAPLFFPSSGLALALLGSSGAVGWAAVACLAANVVRTIRG